MKENRIETARKYIDYLLSVRDELIRAENTVDKIKQSYEWKASQNYFNLLRHRGAISEMPCKRNSYAIPKIISGARESYALVDISELKKYLTDKQITEITKGVAE